MCVCIMVFTTNDGLLKLTMIYSQYNKNNSETAEKF